MFCQPKECAGLPGTGFSVTNARSLILILYDESLSLHSRKFETCDRSEINFRSAPLVSNTFFRSSTEAHRVMQLRIDSSSRCVIFYSCEDVEILNCTKITNPKSQLFLGSPTGTDAQIDFRTIPKARKAPLNVGTWTCLWPISHHSGVNA